VRQQGLGVPRIARTPWRTCPDEAETRNEAGFTLIELIIVTLIIPIIVGAITLALVSVFSLQTGTASRVSDSADAQVVSSNFETDVQNASLITSASSGVSPQCVPGAAGGTQVLGLQSAANGGTVISYEDVANGSGGHSLMRYVCQGGANSSPVSSSAVSNNVPISQTVNITCDSTLASAQTSGSTYTTLNVTPLPAAVQANDQIQVSSGGSKETYVAAAAALGVISLTVGSPSPASSPGFAIGAQVVDTTSWAANNCGANSSWISTASVTAVKFATAGAGKTPYPYTLVAVPRPSSTPSQPTTVTTPNSNCVFATGSGTYTSSLCFVDFSSWNSYTGTSSPQCQGNGLAMSAGITNTSYTLTFCLNVQSVVTATGASVSGSIGTNAGYNGVAAVSFPTYPEAFLGNNGFYTVASTQHPTLYQQNSSVGKTTTVSITNIEVSDTNDGTPATGWELVTGDAETTDASESITWSTSNANTPLNLLPNTPASPIGDACSNPVSPSGLTGVSVVTYIGSQTVECQSSTSDTSQARSGTVMLESPAPTQLTVTMVGTGLEAMFLGVLLPSGS
jgi:prepilin-type N-terminal cleavage/methylation domain-containing protein